MISTLTATEPTSQPVQTQPVETQPFDRSVDRDAHQELIAAGLSGALRDPGF